MRSRLILTGLAPLSLAGAVTAASAFEADFELSFGAGIQPVYEGASDYGAVPAFGFTMKRLEAGSIRFGGTDPKLGLSFGPSFRVLKARKAADFPVLGGIPDVDTAIELGGKVAYNWDFARVYAQARYGVTGHNGIVGETGVEAVLRPDDRTTITFGPQSSFANNA